VCIFPPKTVKPDYRLGGNEMAKRRCTVAIKIYSICRCDDTDNVAPRDIETSNGSMEFNDVMIMIMLFIEMFQRVCEEQK